MNNNKEEGVSGHDDFGTSDDSWHGHLEGTRPDAQGITRQNGSSIRSVPERHSHNERNGEITQEITDDYASDEIEAVFSNLRVSSGPIPDAESLMAYPPEVQAQILDWQDRQIRAMFDDESKRQDRIIENRIAQGKRNQVLSFVINFSIVIGTLIAFVATNNPNVFWSYTVLGASVIGNVVINVGEKKKRRQGNTDNQLDI